MRSWLLNSFIFLLLITSCNEDKSQFDSSDLEGKWTVVSASRNGKATRTFSNAYFIFSSDQSLETNFSGDLIQAAYELKDGTIIQQGDPVVRYDLANWADTSVTLRFQIQEFNFEFVLGREEVNGQ